MSRHETSRSRRTRVVGMISVILLSALSVGSIVSAPVSTAAADPAPAPAQILPLDGSMGLTVFDGTHIWAITGNSLVKIDPATRQLLAEVSVGACPLDLTVVGSSIWTANDCDDTITEVDRATASVVQTINVGAPARAVTSDGINLWVATEATVPGTSRNYVYKINPGTGAVLVRVGVGRMPHSLVFDGSRIWVANSWDWSVTIIDVADTSTTSLSGSDLRYPTDMIFDGTSIWVVGEVVAKIDPVTRTVVGSAAVADGFHLSVAKAGASIWVTTDNGTESSSVSQVDASVTPFAVLHTFTINWRTVGVAFDGTNIWVASRWPNQLCVIDPTSGGNCNLVAPDAPSSLVATPGNGSVSVAFTAGSNGGSAITNYKYQLDGGAWVALSPADSTTPVTIPGLTNYTTYSVRLRAVNAVGDGVASPAVTVRPADAAPVVTSVTSPGRGQVLVSWAVVVPARGRVQWYRVELLRGSTVHRFQWVKFPAAARSVTFSGLRNGATYDVRVWTRVLVGPGNSQQGSTSNPVSVTTAN